MNVVGIIAEYNPFHEGHAYQIQKAKGTMWCRIRRCRNER